MHDPGVALATLQQALENGTKTACIPCRAPAERPYRNPAYEGVWSLAEEAGVPLAMHIGTNSHAPRSTRGTDGGSRANSIATYAAAASVIQATVAELICQGITARHPGLTFVVSEFNAGWLPNWLERLDQGWLRDPPAADPAVDRPPSSYWETNFKVTIEDDRSAVLCRELIGVDTIIWANDYPHRDSTWPCSRSVVESLMSDVPDGERRQMTEATAAQLYGI
ncbi:MAG: amidohydrolase family protein [Actinomycetota bacterium]|nr:amidohydrolase family protein [Actinomycetota bacterium]